MKTESMKEKDQLGRSLDFAEKRMPAYKEILPLLKALFELQIQAKTTLRLRKRDLSSEEVQTRWENGFPLLRRWEFPVDIEVAGRIFFGIKDHIPPDNSQLLEGWETLHRALEQFPSEKPALWESFLHHENKPWQTWMETKDSDLAPMLFLARSCLRPSLESTANEIVSRFPVPKDWFKGYCPICGSLPSLLYLVGQGERRGTCSWCGTNWVVHRIQCCYCDNRAHESLGYLYIEDEPHYRVQYCRLCKMYFKTVDLRQRDDNWHLPLEEWVTLHLDLLAQEAGWRQPPSPSPVVYPET